MATKAELEAELARLQELLGDDDEPSVDPNGYYDPTAIHISASSGIEGTVYLCGEERPRGSWSEKFMDDKVAKKLPKCENCLAMYEQVHGHKLGEGKPKRTPKGIEPPPQPLAEVAKATNKSGVWANIPWLWENGLTINRVPNQ